MSDNNNTKCECNRFKPNECGNSAENCCLHCDCNIYDHKDSKGIERDECKKKIGFNINLKYFDISEFDSPDKPGSGKANMDLNLLILIDKMRHRSGIPYKVTSGFRTPEHHKKLKDKGYKTSETSPHLLGKAVDIAAPTSSQKYKIIEAALHFGIQRIGVGSNFIHIDIQEKPDKPIEVIWTY